MREGMNRRSFLKTSAATGAAMIAGTFLGPESRLAHGAGMNEIEMPTKKVPIAMEADVVVIGGGPGGFAAALRAARERTSVILIDRFDTPGGVHTSGLQGKSI